MKLLGEMPAKSPDDWADGSNHFLFSFSSSIVRFIIISSTGTCRPISVEMGKAATALATWFFSLISP